MSAATPLEQFKADHWVRFAAPMAECDRRLSVVTGEPGGTLGAASSLILAAGGKRMRPLLVFLAARSGTEIAEEHIAAAAAVELVHSATLVHDDILDGAQLRRGQPTPAARYGSPAGTAAGDFLFSSAFRILSGAGSAAAVTILAEASLGLSLGELLQMEQTRDYGLSQADYIERCRLKTAGLFSAACTMGALLSGCSDESISAMDGFGLHLGLAFQIADDILDFTADAAEAGKRAGADLRDGTVTLPLAIAIAEDPALVELFVPDPGDMVIEEICKRVSATGAIEGARELALSHIARASGELERASGEIETGPLALVAGMAVDRKA
ncbi:MAG: polyprenyl synthetase family protein [Thermoleophilia bacterium]|nr:polyprenyl synthetase family protein [Thermoleophilia bacterium]